MIKILFRDYFLPIVMMLICILSFLDIISLGTFLLCFGITATLFGIALLIRRKNKALINELESEIKELRRVKKYEILYNKRKLRINAVNGIIINHFNHINGTTSHSTIQKWVI